MTVNEVRVISMEEEKGMIDLIKNEVMKMCEGDRSGHGFDHVQRVFDMAGEFAEIEGADLEIVEMASLLHDVDDYKMVGHKNAEKLLNARGILDKVGCDEGTRERVLEIIGNMGYSKCLKGIRPTTLEGMCVSDADMCDAMGANGIIRNIGFAFSKRGSGKVFDRDVFPNLEISSEEYSSIRFAKSRDNVINHFFEKPLKLKGLMMTRAGKDEAERRERIMVDFLYEFFREEGVPEWADYLSNYLEGRE